MPSIASNASIEKAPQHTIEYLAPELGDDPVRHRKIRPRLGRIWCNRRSHAEQESTRSQISGGSTVADGAPKELNGNERRGLFRTRVQPRKCRFFDSRNPAKRNARSFDFGRRGDLRSSMTQSTNPPESIGLQVSFFNRNLLPEQVKLLKMTLHFGGCGVWV